MLQKSNERGIPVYALRDNEIPGDASFANTTAKRDEIKINTFHAVMNQGTMSKGIYIYLDANTT